MKQIHEYCTSISHQDTSYSAPWIPQLLRSLAVTWWLQEEQSFSTETGSKKWSFFKPLKPINPTKQGHWSSTPTWLVPSHSSTLFHFWCHCTSLHSLNPSPAPPDYHSSGKQLRHTAPPKVQWPENQHLLRVKTTARQKKQKLCKSLCSMLAWRTH